MKRILFILILACSLAGVVLAEELAANFSLPALDGKKVTLNDFLGKKPVIVTFFASWSDPCKKALKGLQEIQISHEATVKIIAVSYDKKAKELKEFLAAADLPFAVVSDKKLSTADDYKILVLPTTYCINRDGKIDKVLVDYDANVKNSIIEWLNR
ncbi:hypothetical protein A2311_01365 [candidate division WOR-1 bacterium RIFOXYB2_FULL_48_7]|uniref:Thioredoxin domain-containing protein n=1 Tax=candidate division WOR-1 bacterium RIFOXYB2_FULL_48_7 TaxID=1802583 RepID=A0A1F4TU97_UNCSA|nr:MAG: hypothetical protein A2311_01365 [candidate division WOR-1 bacterium RIFOXYB2_FULL_48_7]